MKTRLQTSTYITLALIVMFISRMFTPYVFDAVIILLAIGGAVEMAKAFHYQQRYNNKVVAAIMPILMYGLLIVGIVFKLRWHYFVLSATILLLFAGLFAFVVTYLNKKTTLFELKERNIELSDFYYSIEKGINTAMVFLYPTILFASLIVLNHLPFTYIASVTQVGAIPLISTFFLILAVLITVTTDSFAMIVGSLIKGVKLVPKISPKKTVSGAIGGLLGGDVSAVLLFLLFNTSNAFRINFAKIGSMTTVVVIGLIGAFLCQVGDIFASFIKRKSRIKDYGTIFPGHGGVMDRVDGLLFVSVSVLISVLILL